MGGSHTVALEHRNAGHGGGQACGAACSIPEKRSQLALFLTPGAPVSHPGTASIPAPAGCPGAVPCCRHHAPHRRNSTPVDVRRPHTAQGRRSGEARREVERQRDDKILCLAIQASLLLSHSAGDGRTRACIQHMALGRYAGFWPACLRGLLAGMHPLLASCSCTVCALNVHSLLPCCMTHLSAANCNPNLGAQLSLLCASHPHCAPSGDPFH